MPRRSWASSSTIPRTATLRRDTGFFRSSQRGRARSTCHATGTRNGSASTATLDSDAQRLAVRTPPRSTSFGRPSRTQQPAASGGDRESPREQSRESTGRDRPGNDGHAADSGRSAGHCDRPRTRAIRQANQNLEQMLAMDVQFVEATNAGINLFNDRALPVLKAITGQDWASSPRNGRAGGPISSATPTSRMCPRPSPRTPTSSGGTASVRTCSLLRRRHRRSTRSTARGRSSRSGSAIGSCRRTPRPASSRFSPWWPPIAIGRADAPDLGRRRIDRRHRHPPLLESRQGLDHGPRAQARRSLADGRRHRSRSNRSSPTRLNRSITSTSPITATSSWGPRDSWSTTSVSCSRSSSRSIANQ